MSFDCKTYPFLYSYDYVYKKYPGLSIENLLEDPLSTVKARALNLLEDVLIKGVVEPFQGSCEEHVLTFYSLIIGSKLLNDKRLASRIAYAYSRGSRKRLVEESVEDILTICRAIGFDVSLPNVHPRIVTGLLRKSVIYVAKPFAIPLKQYIKLTSIKLAKDARYSLSNQIVDKGFVYVDRNMLNRLIEEKIYYHILEIYDKIEFNTFKLRSFMEEFKKVLEEKGWFKKYTSESAPSNGVSTEKPIYRPDALPPCIARSVEKLNAGENLSHHERFTIASFFVWVGMGVEEVLNLFRRTPDFNERIARYQVEHIAGLRGSRKKYLPYNCDSLKSLGICPINDYCVVKLKNPLSVYKWNLRRRAKGGADEEVNGGAS